MASRERDFTERPLVKTKIIATVGPACANEFQLKALVLAGVDLFRLNFAHGEHAWLSSILDSIRKVSKELARPIGILGDLSGPKIRLGELPPEGICCLEGGTLEFVRAGHSSSPEQLTCTYDKLIDDLELEDRILLADGMVGLVVIEKPKQNDRIVCRVDRAGCIRSRQGVNLPGVVLSTPSLTEKDYVDLRWAVENQLDYVGYSFVRSADDVKLLRKAIEEYHVEHPPQIVSKIEKIEAINDIEAILDVTDAVMVARGDLGVEVDLARVPVLQKRIIRLCNQHRIPVITATQMLDSMQTSELPTRAEASDVANAVLDGSDAVMLSGETAIGAHPLKAVAMMSQIASEAERLMIPHRQVDSESRPHTRAKLVTEATTLGAGVAAEHLEADLIVVATHSGKTAMAVSKQRNRVPILALSDCPETTRRMCLYWGVSPMETSVVQESPRDLIEYVVDWGKREGVLSSGSRMVIVASSDWSTEGHDLMLIHAIP